MSHDYQQPRWKRRIAYVDGTALTKHAYACHDGLVDPDCPACSEIQDRMEVLGSNPQKTVDKINEVVVI